MEEASENYRGVVVEHLRPEELRYELEIRNLIVNQNAQSLREDLKRALSDEEDGEKTVLTSALAALDPRLESEACTRLFLKVRETGNLRVLMYDARDVRDNIFCDVAHHNEDIDNGTFTIEETRDPVSNSGRKANESSDVTFMTAERGWSGELPTPAPRVRQQDAHSSNERSSIGADATRSDSQGVESDFGGVKRKRPKRNEDERGNASVEINSSEIVGSVDLNALLAGLRGSELEKLLDLMAETVQSDVSKPVRTENRTVKLPPTNNSNNPKYSECVGRREPVRAKKSETKKNNLNEWRTSTRLRIPSAPSECIIIPRSTSSHRLETDENNLNEWRTSTKLQVEPFRPRNVRFERVNGGERPHFGRDCPSRRSKSVNQPMSCYGCRTPGVRRRDCQRCSVNPRGGSKPSPEIPAGPRSNFLATKQIEKSVSDGRPYIYVNMYGERKVGLLDSGASVTVKKLCPFNESQKKDIKPSSMLLQTVGGEKIRVVGVLEVTYEYQGRRVVHPTVIVNNLEQDLFLGFGFWRVAGLKIANIKLEAGLSEISPTKLDIKCRTKLSTDERLALQLIIDSFPVATENFLGRSNAIVHPLESSEMQRRGRRLELVGACKLLDAFVEHS